MGKIKAFFRNKWVGFTLASILYILWFVLWTGNWWLLLGEIVIFDLSTNTSGGTTPRCARKARATKPFTNG